MNRKFVYKKKDIYRPIHVIDLGLSVLGLGSDDPRSSIDAINGTIGSLDEISVDYAEGDMLKFTVYNEMGLESFSRVFGTDESLMDNECREGPRNWGGSIFQEFYWFEEIGSLKEDIE